MKKDFDKQEKKQLKQIYSIFHLQNLGNDEISDKIKSHNEIVDSLSEVPPWSHFYELPYRTFLAVFAVAFEITDIIKSIANAPDQIQAFVDYVDNMPDTSNDDEDLSDEEKGFGIALVMAVNRQQYSISINSQSLSELVSRVRSGDDNALFDAVLVDRSIVSAPSIAHRIQTAQLNNDESFMALLSKAITRTRPRRPQKKYDDLRYMIGVIDEELGLDNISNDKLYNILAKDLQIYDGSRYGLGKFIQRRANEYKT